MPLFQPWLHYMSTFIFLPIMIDYFQTQLIATYLLLLSTVIIPIKYKKKSFKRPPSTWPVAKPVTLSATSIKLKPFKTKSFWVQQKFYMCDPFRPPKTQWLSAEILRNISEGGHENFIVLSPRTNSHNMFRTFSPLFWYETCGVEKGIWGLVLPWLTKDSDIFF